MKGYKNGWGGRIRTYECQIQILVTYRLSTPQIYLWKENRNKRGVNLNRPLCFIKAQMGPLRAVKPRVTLGT